MGTQSDQEFAHGLGFLLGLDIFQPVIQVLKERQAILCQTNSHWLWRDANSKVKESATSGSFLVNVIDCLSLRGPSDSSAKLVLTLAGYSVDEAPSGLK